MRATAGKTVDSRNAVFTTCINEASFFLYTIIPYLDMFAQGKERIKVASQMIQEEIKSNVTW